MPVSELKDSSTFSISVVDYTKPVCGFWGIIGHKTKKVDIEATSPEEAIKRAEELGYLPNVVQ